MRYRLLLAAIAVIAIGQANPIQSAVQADGPARGRITGTITIRGCSLSPADLVLRAHPADAYAPDDGPPPGAPRSGTRVARISTTDDPSALDFVITGLEHQQPYQLGIRQSSRVCGKVMWTVPDGGMTAADDPTPVEIEGVAVRSRLEVLGAAVGRPAPRWVGADHLDFTDPSAAVRIFRWRTDVAGATGGELQISTEPFPVVDPDAGACGEPASGVVYRQAFDIPARGGWASPAAVDFFDVLTPARVPGPDGDGVGAGGDVSVVDESTYQRLLSGAPVYVRVVPTRSSPDGGGEPVCDVAADGVPGGVVLSKLALVPGLTAPDAGDISLAVGVYTPPLIKPYPWGNEVCYQVVKNHFVYATWPPQPGGQFDWFAVWTGTLPNESVVLKGQSFCVPSNPGNDSLIGLVAGGFADTVTGLVDAVGSAVTFFSVLYEDIQNEVAAVAADAINALGIPCDEQCEKGIKVGLQTGLATMGAPPSLPNFDELVDEGVDYLAAEVASETGVPGPVADFATGKAKEYVLKAAELMEDNQTQQNGMPDWVTLDVGMDPAVLSLHLESTATQFPSGPALAILPNPLYRYWGAKLPRRWPPPAVPGQPSSLTVPVVLWPDFSGLPPLPFVTEEMAQKNAYFAYSRAVWFKQRWDQQRLSVIPCVNFTGWAFGGGAPAANKLFSADVLSKSLAVFFADTSYCTPPPQGPTW